MRRCFRTKHRKHLRHALVVAALSSPAVSFGVIVPPASVTLGWDASSGNVAGYRLYYGPTSGIYTNSIDVGNTTSNKVSGLANGSTYFFAVTAYSIAGVESGYSNEINYTPGAPGVRIRLNTPNQATITVSGLAGHTYEILATQDLTSWTVIGTTTLGSSGSSDFTDTNAVYFPARFYRTREKP